MHFGQHAQSIRYYKSQSIKLNSAAGLHSNEKYVKILFCINFNILYTTVPSSLIQRESWHGPLAKYVKLCVGHAPGMPGTFFPANVGKRSRHASRHVRHARAVMHARSLTSGFLWSRWQGRRFPHSRHMRNPKFYVSDKRPMDTICHVTCRSRLIVKEMCFWEFLYFV